jgi:hypothetical protein
MYVNLIITNHINLKSFKMKHLILILLCFSQIAICQENKNIAGKITTWNSIPE